MIQTNKVCRRCHGLVLIEETPELKEEYPYFCPECDENLYEFETLDMEEI